jgi:hypothetical protein
VVICFAFNSLQIKDIKHKVFPLFSLWDKRSRKELLVKSDRNFNRTRPYLSTEKDRCTQFPPKRNKNKTKQNRNKAKQKQNGNKLDYFFLLLLPPSMCMLQAFPGSRCVLENTFNAIQAERLRNNYPIRIYTILPYT